MLRLCFIIWRSRNDCVNSIDLWQRVKASKWAKCIIQCLANRQSEPWAYLSWSFPYILQRLQQQDEFLHVVLLMLYESRYSSMEFLGVTYLLLLKTRGKAIHLRSRILSWVMRDSERRGPAMFHSVGILVKTRAFQVYNSSPVSKLGWSLRHWRFLWRVCALGLTRDKWEYSPLPSDIRESTAARLVEEWQ